MQAAMNRFTDGYRLFAKDYLGWGLYWLTRSANIISVAGVAVAITACFIWASHGNHPNNFWWGILLGLAGALIDSFDGAAARAADERKLRGSTPFGKLLDSVGDRVVEFAMFATLAYWSYQHGQNWGMIGAGVAAASSFLVSYLNAKSAQVLDGEQNHGLAPRWVRLVLLGIGVLVCYPGGEDYTFAVWLVALPAIFTIGQRLVDIYRKLDSPPVGFGFLVRTLFLLGLLFAGLGYLATWLTG